MRGDEIGGEYRLLLAAGVVGALILAVGALQFLHFEPPGQHTGLHARVLGAFRVDPASGRVAASSNVRFRPDQPFAAVVDWTSLPSRLNAGGHWFEGGFATASGGVGPGPAAELPAVVPVEFRDRLPPGRYTFVVERYAGGRPVEVLARLAVIVLAP